CASFSLVPTPSVPDTRTGSSYLPVGNANNPPKPPSPVSTSGRAVRATSGFIRSTNALPASMSTPASLYVSGLLVMFAGLVEEGTGPGVRQYNRGSRNDWTRAAFVHVHVASPRV